MQKSADSTRPFNYLAGLINAVVLFAVVWALWYVFMNPNTVLKLYTPMYGFALIVVFVAVILLLSKVTDFYPLAPKSETGGGIGRGIALTVLSVALTLFLFYGVFWNFLGRFGIAYFSPQSIIASGGVGAEFFVARENACTAMIYYFTAFVWMVIFWRTGFGTWPWQDCSRSVAAWSRLFALLFLAIILYSVTFHPHVCALFYPAQDKAGVTPWWADMVGTGSAFFSLGILIACIFWLLAFDALWENRLLGAPGPKGEGTFLRGLGVFVLSSVLGLLLVYGLTRIMNQVWNEPFVGGQYTDGPDFRYLHAGEISGFFVLGTFLLKYCFNNFPNAGGIWLRGLVRTLLAMALGMLFYLFYYSPLSTLVLAKVPGVAQPGDTPLVWTFLFVSILLVQVEFFGGWPLYRRRK